MGGWVRVCVGLAATARSAVACCGYAPVATIECIQSSDLLTEGDHVLEVGCGWGSFAMRAAQRTGCRVTGITVSKEQLAEATARVKAAGLADRVTLMFCDYRECPGAGTYDKVGARLQAVDLPQPCHVSTWRRGRSGLQCRPLAADAAPLLAQPWACVAHVPSLLSQVVSSSELTEVVKHLLCGPPTPSFTSAFPSPNCRWSAAR